MQGLNGVLLALNHLNVHFRVMPPAHAKHAAVSRFPRRWAFIGAYLFLLACSWVFQRFFESTPEYAPEEIRLTNLTSSKGSNLPVVVIPRLPDDSDDHALSKELTPQSKSAVYRMTWPAAYFQKIRPDSSTRDVAEDLIQQLPPGRVHFVGEGMGGVVALEVASAHPERVASLTFISSPGAQEYTLLGNAVANKFVYFFHHAAFVLIDNLTPHFGLANRLPMNRAYSSVLFDTDLSQSSEKLTKWSGPALLIHGEDDWVTPADAARYSAKLMPQAELEIMKGGRTFSKETEKQVVDKILKFQSRVESNQATLRSPSASVDSPYPELVNSGGARYWILLLIIIVCTFVAEDPTCLACGLLASQGIIDFTSAALACTSGIFIGDMVLYTLGRTLGRDALRYPPLKWIVQEHEIDQMAGWFSSPRGMLVIVSSRFIPASRVPTFITAGLLRLSLPRLGALLFTAALIWTPVLMWLGYTFGPPFMEQFPHYKKYAAWIILGSLAGIWFLTHWVLPALTWRGRRELVMKFRRMTRVSLWSNTLLYLPIRLVILLTSLRLRSLTAFASANPGFGRMGGFIGDEKSALLEHFESDPRTCPTLRLLAEDSNEVRVASARAFAGKYGFALILKPEIAEDGAGLRIIQGDESLVAALQNCTEDWVLQPRLPGREFEVVWRRAPGSSKGLLMAVVEKRNVTLVGNGTRTLEELIHADDVAINRADLYLHLHSRHLTEVPAAGESVILNLTGSYGHGVDCVYRPDLLTEALRDSVTAYCRQFPGLHYARLDLRATDEDDLRAGKFKVTEVGGCCHVSSVVRDSSLGVWNAYPIVWRQVRLCLQAGADNLRLGVRPVPLTFVLTRWSQARGRSDGFAIVDRT